MKANQDWARGDYGSAIVEEAKDMGDRFRAAFAPDRTVVATQTYGVPPPAAERVGEADTLPGSMVQPSITDTSAVYASTTTTETTRPAVP